MLEGKFVVVTGASRGIGEAIARLFAKNNANLFLVGREISNVESIATELADNFKIKAIPLECDLSDEQSLKSFFRTLRNERKNIDILINNAGVMDDNLLGMISHDSMRNIFEVNTLSVISLMQYAARAMGENGGSIVNISSIIGTHGNRGQVVYSASKAAVIGATKSAAKELANRNIRVNVIAPGFIETDLVRNLPEKFFKERLNSIAMERIGGPEEVANCALFLASELSSYVTGQVLGVDGGMVI
jgi:3-oxoacyl-[acyl-carrier protein] reductase